MVLASLLALVWHFSGSSGCPRFLSRPFQDCVVSFRLSLKDWHSSWSRLVAVASSGSATGEHQGVDKWVAKASFRFGISVNRTGRFLNRV